MNLKYCIKYSGLSVSRASEFWTDTVVGYLWKGLWNNQVFYDISTGSEHYIFPFHAEWLSKGRELEIFFKYFEELFSFAIDFD
jgi:hypothetical protein